MVARFEPRVRGELGGTVERGSQRARRTCSGTGPSWVLPTSELWEAGERPGLTCAIEVEGA